MWPRFTVKGEEIIEDKRWARELGEQLQVNTWLPMDLGLPSRSCPRSWRRADTGGIITKVSFGVYTRQEHPKLPSPSLLVGRQVTMPCGTKMVVDAADRTEVAFDTRERRGFGEERPDSYCKWVRIMLTCSAYPPDPVETSDCGSNEFVVSATAPSKPEAK